MQVKVKLNLKRNIVDKEDKKHSSYYYQFDRNKSTINDTWENAVVVTDSDNPNNQLVIKKKIIKWTLVVIVGILLYIFLKPKPKKIIQEQELIEVIDCSHYDTIPTYNSFKDIPAGIETKIIIDGIVYQINDNKTLWTPVYPDEYVLWIGANGDTIWE